MCGSGSLQYAAAWLVALQTPKAAEAVRKFGKHLSIDATFDAVETRVDEPEPADQMFTVHVVDTGNHAVPVCSFYGDDKRAEVRGMVAWCRQLMGVFFVSQLHGWPPLHPATPDPSPRRRFRPPSMSSVTMPKKFWAGCTAQRS